MFPRRRCADSRLDHVAGEEVVMRPQGGFVSQLDAPDPRRLMPYGAVKRHKSAHTALAVKACLLGGKTATLNAQSHLLI